MSVDWGSVYSELKGWQSGIAAVTGFGGLIAAALFNARLNRKRDQRLRSQEVVAVASALYGEIVILRQALARMANRVGQRFLDHGVGRVQESFDRHFMEQITLPPSRLYAALAEKVGTLPSQIALEIVRFYARVEEAQAWLPRLQENGERPFSYSILYVLDPAIEAITGVIPALRAIEEMASVPEQATTPDIKRAIEAQEIERELWKD